MPKALIHCFSGTGNTQVAADIFMAELAKQVYDAEPRSIEEGLCNSGETADLHVFFFPVYATAMPHIMAKYLSRLPRGQGTKVAVISTNGRISSRIRDGYQGWALHQARLILKLRQYDAFYSDTFDMPHNITAFGLPGKDDSREKLILATAPMIVKAAQKAAKGEGYHRKVFLPNFLWCVPFSLFYSWSGRHTLGKLFASDGKCTGCGLCAKKCPAHNIKMIGRQSWFGWGCEGCMRCINACPARAIQFSAVRLAAFAFASLWNPLIAFGLYKTGFLAGTVGGFGAFILNLIFVSVCTFVLFNVLDWILFALGFVPWVRRVVAWGHTTLFGRYNGEKFKI